MNALINNFKSSNKTIAATVAKLVGVTYNPVYRLALPAVDVRAVEGSGQFDMEMDVTLELLNASYWELSAAINSEEDDKSPVFGRDKNPQASCYKPEEDGGNATDEKRVTKDQRIERAIAAAAMVYRYASHLAKIDGAGLGRYLHGSTRTTWAAVKESDTEAVEACKTNVNLHKMILDGRVVKTTVSYAPKIKSYEQWCKDQMTSAKVNDGLKAYIASAQVAQVEVPDTSNETFMKMMASWADDINQKHNETRLNLAVKRVANTQWFFTKTELGRAELSGNTGDLVYTMRKWGYLIYSNELQIDIANFKESLEYKMHQMDLRIEQERKALVEEQLQLNFSAHMLGIKKQAAEIQVARRSMEAERAKQQKMMDEIEAMLTPPAPQPTAEELEAQRLAAEKKAAAQEKAKATREAKKAAAQALKDAQQAKKNAPTKGIAGKRSAFDHLTAK